MIERQQVASSQIASIGYDKASKKLHIEFKGGNVYEYDDIAEDVYQGLVGAPSIGKYFHANIKTNPDITYRKLPPVEAGAPGA